MRQRGGREKNKEKKKEEGEEEDDNIYFCLLFQGFLYESYTIHSMTCHINIQTMKYYKITSAAKRHMIRTKLD